MSPNHWKHGFYAGLFVLVVALVLLPLFPKSGGTYPKGYGPPVFAFEMAKTKADLDAVFGPKGDPKRKARMAAMDRGNIGDYVFMIAYGAFLWLFFAACSHTTGRRYWLVLGAFGVLGGLSDAVENVILLGITANIDQAPYLSLLTYPVWIKFFLLMFAGWGTAAFLFTRSHWAWKSSGILVGLSACTVAVGWSNPALYGQYVGKGITVVWLLQLIYAGTQLHQRSQKQEQATG